MSFSPLLFDLKMEDLYANKGLQKIHNSFLSFLKDGDDALYLGLIECYDNYENVSETAHQNLCADIAPFVEDFISYLFNIFSYSQLVQQQHQSFSIITKVNRLFIQRFVIKQKNEDLLKAPSLPVIIKDTDDFDYEFSKAVIPFIETLNNPSDERDVFTKYALWAMHSKEGQAKHKDSILFKTVIKKTAVQSFFDVVKKNEKGAYLSKDLRHPLTEKFSCTDDGLSFKKAIDQATYCIKCHPRGKDSCRKGLYVNEELVHKGCPLKEKISPMMALKGQGYVIGALAIICTDNPMVAVTGHRICNDCRLACIYQKQESVDVPGVETNVLQSVLNLPYGFEIYSLLTRWNPLNIKQPLPLPSTGYTTLVVGQGPAGFSLSHYLIRSGVQVMAIDGLKIEPLPPYLLNVKYGIKDIKAHLHDLDKRIVYGFGGVAEYGITIRWNKNNLMIIRLILERNALYHLQGGIRFGSQLDEQQAFDMGIDHIALCMGAGSPKMLNFKDEFPKGVRLASDFLMSLQLTGAFKENSYAKLTVDMPVVVIGGGLTAIDAATEAQRYYLRQIQKIHHRIAQLKAKNYFDEMWKSLLCHEQDQLLKWLDHAEEFNIEKEKAKDQNIDFNAIPLLHKWGGVSVIYRKELKYAPSVSLNVEEVQKAMEEGIFIQDEFTPTNFIIDEHQNIEGVEGFYEHKKTIINAKTVLIAIGTETLKKF